MNKTNKSIPKKQAKNEPDAVLCDGCDLYYYSRWLRMDESGKRYCNDCHAMGIVAQSIPNQVKDKEVEKVLKALLNAPPRKRSKKKKRKN